MTGTTITPLNLEEMPPIFEPCVMVDGRCTTWCHKFRVDHQNAHLLGGAS